MTIYLIKLKRGIYLEEFNLDGDNAFEGMENMVILCY